MKSKQVRPTTGSHLVPRVLVAALVLALAFNNLAQAAPSVKQSIRLFFKYELKVLPNRLTLCTGEVGEVRVNTFRSVDVMVDGKLQTGRPYPISGGSLYGRVSNPRIAAIPNPNQSATVVQGEGDHKYAYFGIEGKSPGETLVFFFARTLGDENVFPKKHTTQSAILSVEVVPCYEAIQSALGDEWPRANVCSFKEPFVLEGKFVFNTGGVTWTNRTLLLFRPVSTVDGHYGFMSKQSFLTPDGTLISAYEIGRGAYLLEMNPQEVNITLPSESIYCIGGMCSPIAESGYIILLRPRDNLSCKG